MKSSNQTKQVVSDRSLRCVAAVLLCVERLFGPQKASNTVILSCHAGLSFWFHPVREKLISTAENRKKDHTGEGGVDK